MISWEINAVLQNRVFKKRLEKVELTVLSLKKHYTTALLTLDLPKKKKKRFLNDQLCGNLEHTIWRTVHLL